MNDLIPKDRRMSTGARLRLVADIIEAHPEAHEQALWCKRFDSSGWAISPQVVSKDADCGTSACVAGWAVVCTPPEELDVYDGWVDAGARALGLPYDVADLLFQPDNRREALVEALRALAEIPDDERRNPAGGVTRARSIVTGIFDYGP